VTTQHAITATLISVLAIIFGLFIARELDLWIRDRAIHRRAGKRKGMLGGR
jgi:hypothetical protein